MFEIPEEWFEGRIDPDKLSEHTVPADMWDQQDLQRSVSSVSEFEAARQKLTDFVATGQPAMNDTFWSLLKARPGVKEEKDVKPSFLANLRVQKQMRELAEWSHLRRFSIGDDVQAALSAAMLEEDLETLFDRTERSRQKAEELQQKMQDLAAAQADVDLAQRDLDDLIEQWGGQPSDEQGDGDGDGDGEGEGEGQGPPGTGTDPQQAGGGNPSDQPGQGELTDDQQQQLNDAAKAVREAQEKLDATQAEARAVGEGLNNMAEREAAEVRNILQAALQKATQDARDQQGAAVAWGLEPGKLKRMPADERMELARKLSDQRMRDIAALFGPLWNAFVSEQMRRTPDARSEYKEITLGDDIALVLGSELMLLDDEDAEWEFYRRFTEKQLIQFNLDGDEPLARGAIIMPIDGSGSMMGDRELWAKAIMLCLLHHARKQNRQFHVIHFGSPGQYKTVSFLKPEDFTFERILDAAEPWWGGGTDFVTPMKESLRLLDEEFAATGRVTADVVFTTDDECWVDDEFMTHWLTEAERMQFTTWGVNVSGSATRVGALTRMTSDPKHETGKVATVKDFLGADDVRSIFRGV